MILSAWLGCYPGFGSGVGANLVQPTSLTSELLRASPERAPPGGPWHRSRDQVTRITIFCRDGASPHQRTSALGDKASPTQLPHVPCELIIEVAMLHQSADPPIAASAGFSYAPCSAMSSFLPPGRNDTAGRQRRGGLCRAVLMLGKAYSVLPSWGVELSYGDP